MSADHRPPAPTILFLDLFESFGMTHTALMMLPLDEGKIDGKKVGGEKKRFIPKLSAGDLRRRLPKIIEDADRNERSVVVSHPDAPGIKFIQCDDVSGEMLTRLKPVAFMTLETSPGSFQAWVAMREEEAESGDYYRRLRKGVGSDKSASEATRCPGSHTFKTKYRDTSGNYPMVRILHAAPGKIATGKELVATGLLAEPEVHKATVQREPITKGTIPRKLTVSTSYARSGAQQWPDYAECVEYGKQRGDRDLGDHRFAWIAAARGFSLDEVASELMRISPRAAEDGDPDRYCRRKAEAGAEFAVKRSKLKGEQKPFARSRTPVQGETPFVDSVMSFGKPSRSIAPPALGAKRSKLKSAQKPLGRSITPVRGGTALVDSATGPGGPPRPNAGTKKKVRSRVLAICSTREDAVALQEATGIRAVRISLKFFPVKMQLRCALRRVIIATRQDKFGEALARRIVETCTLSTLKRIPWPQEELDGKNLRDTLRNLFGPH